MQRPCSGSTSPSATAVPSVAASTLTGASVARSAPLAPAVATFAAVRAPLHARVGCRARSRGAACGGAQAASGAPRRARDAEASMSRESPSRVRTRLVAQGVLLYL